jgi:hypothetical protein
MFKMTTQGLPDEPPRQNFANPIDCEAEYFRLSRLRTDGPGAVKIYSEVPGVLAPAYYRLDSSWGGVPREQDPGRVGLWSEAADEGYTAPTAAQLRGIARVLGLSGEEISRRLGITGRLWRYWLAEDGEQREIPWTAWRVLRMWLNA